VSEGPLVADVVPQLAEQLPELRVTHVCRCGRPYCGSFWTARRPMRRWVNRGREVELREGLPGEVALTVVRGQIDYVEVLFWDEVRDAIARVSLPE
jgi:hypothetical protein